MNQPNFKIGDLVWAKMKGYPPWPAEIAEPPDGSNSKKQYYVYFYGCNMYGWVAKHNIQVHSEKLSEQYLSSKKKPKDYALGISAINQAHYERIHSCVEDATKNEKNCSLVDKIDERVNFHAKKSPNTAVIQNGYASESCNSERVENENNKNREILASETNLISSAPVELKQLKVVLIKMSNDFIEKSSRKRLRSKKDELLNSEKPTFKKSKFERSSPKKEIIKPVFQKSSERKIVPDETNSNFLPKLRNGSKSLMCLTNYSCPEKENKRQFNLNSFKQKIINDEKRKLTTGEISPDILSELKNSVSTEETDQESTEESDYQSVDETDEDETEQDETEQDETEQDETEQDETDQYETDQYETDQDETDQDETDQESIDEASESSQVFNPELFNKINPNIMAKRKSYPSPLTTLTNYSVPKEKTKKLFNHSSERKITDKPDSELIHVDDPEIQAELKSDPSSLMSIITNYPDCPENPLFGLYHGGPTDLEKKFKNICATHKKIGFIGLGRIGMRIVKNLIFSKHSVTIWNRTPQRCAPFFEATKANSPAEVVMSCDIIFLCLSDAKACKSVFLMENGVLSALRACDSQFIKGFVELTSSDANTVKDLSDQVHSLGALYLDAPLLGTKEDAENGKLLIICSGDKLLFDDCKSCFDAISRKYSFLCSSVGNATMYCNIKKMMKASFYTVFAEALGLIDKVGLDKKTFINDLVTSEPLFDFDENFKQYTDFHSEDPQVNVNTPLRYMQYSIAAAKKLADSVEFPMLVNAAANEILKRNICYKCANHDVAAILKPI